MPHVGVRTSVRHDGTSNSLRGGEGNAPNTMDGAFDNAHVVPSTDVADLEGRVGVRNAHGYTACMHVYTRHYGSSKGHTDSGDIPWRSADVAAGWTVELDRHVLLNTGGRALGLTYLHVLLVIRALAVDTPCFTLHACIQHQHTMHACIYHQHAHTGTNDLTLGCLSRHWLSKSPSEAPQ